MTNKNPQGLVTLNSDSSCVLLDPEERWDHLYAEAGYWPQYIGNQRIVNGFFVKQSGSRVLLPLQLAL